MPGARRVVFIATIFLMIFCALVTGMTLQWFSAQRDQMVNEAKLQNQMRARTFEQFTLRMLAVARQSLDYVGHELDHSPEMTGEELADVLREALGRSVILRGIYVRTPSARAATDRDFLLEPTLENELRERLAKFGGEGWLSRPLAIGAEKEVLALAIKPRADSERYLFAFFSPTVLTAFSEHDVYEESELISLIGLDGVTRIRRTGSNYTGGDNLAGTLVMRRQYANPNGTYIGPHSITGEPYIFSHRRIEDYHVFATSGMRRDRYLGALVQDRLIAIAVISISVVGSVIALAFLFVYLRRRARQVAAAQASIERLNYAQALGQLGDWEYNVSNATFIFSDNLQHIYGIDRAELGHLELTDFLNLESFSKFSEALDQIKANKTSKTFELEGRTADGSASMRRITASPQLDDEGQVVKIYGVDQSIDDERNLQFLRARAAAQARLQSMSALTATLAHEVNQPLTVIANFLSVAIRRLQDGKDGDRQVVTYLRKARKQVTLLGEMIGAARELVSPNDDATETFPLYDPVSDALELLEADPNYDTSSIHVDDTTAALHISGRKALVKQVFYNLIKNALEAGGDEPPKVEVQASAKGNWVEVSIRDDGPGFEMSNQAFDAFSSAKPEGLGLGLALSRTIVEAQGGRIWVEEPSGKGAEICFTLPRAEPFRNNGQ